MNNISVVEKIENGVITVSTVRKGACGDNCAMCGSCASQKVYSAAYSDISVNVGDVVTVESNTASVLLAMVSLFILPLVLPIVLYLLLTPLSSVLGYVGIAAGILLSVVFILLLSRSTVYIKKITPKITSVIKKK